MSARERIKPVTLLVPQSLAGAQAAVNGPVIDTRDPAYKSAREWVAIVVTGAGAAPLTPRLQHSDNAAGPFEDAAVGAQMAANQVQELGVRFPKRYLRLQVSTGGAGTDSIQVSAVAVAADPREIPF